MKQHRKLVVGSLALATSFFIAANPADNLRRLTTLNGWAPWLQDGNFSQRKLNQLSVRGSVAAGEWRSSLWASQKQSAEMDSFRDEAEKAVKNVDDSFQDFIRKNPSSMSGRMAYGEFLQDIGKQNEAVEQWETARAQHTDNPIPWVHLANHYAHGGNIPKAIQYFESGLKLPHATAEQYRNYAVVTYLFRKDFKRTFGWTEEQTYNASIQLYRKAVNLDPGNFSLATDYAMTFYAIRPRRCQEAIDAWNAAMKKAPNEVEAERIHLHLARFYIHAGEFNNAQTHLAVVDSPIHAPQKERVTKMMNETEQTFCQRTLIASLESDSIEELSSEIATEASTAVPT
ncbi:MAG TPA: tetratricopeptide repeat protein, partial [Roseimicrobium sp.]|nr:tetratricopeptide repeat protein [Roseimicrobium sp.]